MEATNLPKRLALSSLVFKNGGKNTKPAEKRKEEGQSTDSTMTEKTGSQAYVSIDPVQRRNEETAMAGNKKNDEGEGRGAQGSDGTTGFNEGNDP